MLECSMNTWYLKDDNKALQVNYARINILQISDEVTHETSHAYADDLQIFYRRKECGLAVQLSHRILAEISRLHLGTEKRRETKTHTSD